MLLVGLNCIDLIVYGLDVYVKGILVANPGIQNW